MSWSCSSIHVRCFAFRTTPRLWLLMIKVCFFASFCTMLLLRLFFLLLMIKPQWALKWKRLIFLRCLFASSPYRSRHIMSGGPFQQVLVLLLLLLLSLVLLLVLLFPSRMFPMIVMLPLLLDLLLFSRAMMRDIYFFFFSVSIIRGERGIHAGECGPPLVHLQFE